MHRRAFGARPHGLCMQPGAASTLKGRPAGAGWCSRLPLRGRWRTDRRAQGRWLPRSLRGRCTHCADGEEECGSGIASARAWRAVGQWAAAARREAAGAASKWRPIWAVLAGYAPVTVRLHLALFYFYGVYYHWAKRATGTCGASCHCSS